MKKIFILVIALGALSTGFAQRSYQHNSDYNRNYQQQGNWNRGYQPGENDPRDYSGNDQYNSRGYDGQFNDEERFEMDRHHRRHRRDDYYHRDRFSRDRYFDHYDHPFWRR